MENILVPIDIVAVIAALAPIISAYIGLKSAKQDSELKQGKIQKTPVMPMQGKSENTRVFILCFFIYAICGLLSGALGWLSDFTGKSNWGSTNLVWVIGNSIIAFLIYGNYLSKKKS